MCLFRRVRRTPLILLMALGALFLPAGASADVPRSFYGVSAINPTSMDYDGIAMSGIGVSRFVISWRVIQKTRKGGYDWGYVDREMLDIATAGLQPTPVVFGTPRFIRKSPSSRFPPISTRANRKEWQQLLRAAVRRYGPGGMLWRQNPGVPAAPVRRWIIWNEQNARAFWQPRTSPSDYATLVRISDRAISRVDRRAKLILGGMYGYPQNPKSISAVKFLRRFYRTKGIKRHFSAINVHPYGAGVGAIRRQVKEARTVARKGGDRKVGLLVGELGWASSGPLEGGMVVGELGQARRLEKGLRLLATKRRAWNLIGAYVYVWRDFTTATPCPWCPGAGLLEADGTAKPALEAVRDVISSTR